MYPFLLEPQNIIIQGHDQGQEKENESQVWAIGSDNLLNAWRYLKLVTITHAMLEHFLHLQNILKEDGIF